jgi:hypothetical protein
MPEPIPKRFLFFRIPDDPKGLRQVQNVIGFFFVVCTAFLFFKDYPYSSALAALGCAVLMMVCLAIGHRLDMIDLLRRIEALERPTEGEKGRESN